MLSLLVTGFTPFDGRNANASWIAARSLAEAAPVHEDVHITTMEIPVVWGKPGEMIGAFCEQHCPDAIICMGEGRPEWIDIETVAQNQRAIRPDNDGNVSELPIAGDGPRMIDATVNTIEVQKNLRDLGWNVRRSSDAGQFLCEETLYTVERLKNRHAKIQQVIFVHLPPFETKTWLRNKPVTCDEQLVSRFARELCLAITQMLEHN